MTDEDTSVLPHRPVRSFVRREGRFTAGQQRAFDELLPRYGVPAGTSMLDFPTLFGRTAPVILDIGFGDGEALVELARLHPERDYLGVEVYRSGIGRVLRCIETERIGNICIACTDAVELLRERVPEASLAGVQLFFPDPWPKKRHHKRRMVQPDWLDLVAQKLAPDGFLHLATDWADYAEHMLELADAAPAFDNAAGRGRYSPDRGQRPGTRFERRGQHKGHEVRDLVLRRR